MDRGARVGWELAHGRAPDFAIFLDIDRRCPAAGDCHTHMTAQEARARLGAAFWDEAFKFSIERHPYEKAVSQAWFSWARRRFADTASLVV